jgi:glucosamine--fructose-6-phosphate aminotransferase (isomerizing)
VIAHLIHSVYRDDLLDAVRRAVKRLHGAYAIAVLSACEPQRLVAARAGSPLVIGIGADQNYLASDCAALGELTDRFVYLEDGDVALITPERIAVVDSVGSDAQRPLCVVQARDHDAALGPYRHFMQKEIFEQPKAIAATLDGVDTVSPALFGDDETARALLSKTRSVLLLGCGTSYYAGLTAKYWLEGIAGIRARSRSPASIVIARPCPIRTRWSWAFRSRAKRRTRSARSSMHARWASICRWRSATSRPARSRAPPRSAS